MVTDFAALFSDGNARIGGQAAQVCPIPTGPLLAALTEGSYAISNFGKTGISAEFSVTGIFVTRAA